jgi:drug/metabolite transporter (DMT)-like permease
MPRTNLPAAHTLAHRLWAAPYLLLTFAVLAWSGNIVLGRAVHATIPPVALAFWRWSVAFLIVLLLGWRHVLRDRAALERSWRFVLLLALLGISAYNTLVYIGLGSTMAVNALLLQSAMPLVILVFSFLLFRERARPLQVAGIAASLAGVVVIASRGAPASLLHLAVAPGDLWVLTAILVYALYSALLRRRPDVHPLSFLVTTFGIGAAVLLPFYVWETLTMAPLRPTPTAFVTIAYVAVFPSFLAYLCFNRGVELVGANRAGPFLHLMPVFGSLLAMLFLGERLQGFHLAGIALIAAGIALATAARR